MRVRGLALIAGAALSAAPSVAQAFCGFYVSPGDQKLTNNATMTVLMREGQRTVLSMQNNYKGPPSDFAMVVPVPIVLQKENVKTLPREVFDKVDVMASPRLVEYWEQDPCPREHARKEARGPSAPAKAPTPAAAGAGPADLGVRVEAEFTVGEYEVVVLSAQDSGGLDTWLRQNHYKIPEGAEPVLRPYVAKAMKFFVAKVNIGKVKFENGEAALSPIRFHYDSDDFSLPVRLGLLNSDGKQELVVHILARGKRYEVANYPNVTIPTNYDVAEETREKFGAFYAALFDRTLEKHPGAIVTEYAWDASTCDPCPGPSLQASDIITLGADVLAPTDPPPNLATPPGTRATVVVGEPVNPNGLPNARPMLHRMQRQFESCYWAELARTPSPKGRVKLSMEAGANRIQKVRSSGPLPPAMMRCVEQTVRSGYFPGPSMDAKVELTVDFNLEPGEAGKEGWWKPPPVSAWGFTLTRLHTRYSKEVLGQDLIFREAPAIIGGREDHRTGGAEQDHGAKAGGSTNNFQARYAIRHPWTGPITCDKPQRGVWGGPPAGSPGTSLPKAASKIAHAPRGGVELSSLVRQSIPELGLVPKGDVAGTPGAPAGKSTKGTCACSTPGGGDALLPSTLAAFAALLMNERRRRRR